MKKKLTGSEKAALVLLAMSEENVSKVFSKMKEEEIKELSYAMVSLGSVDTEIINSVVEDFKKEVTTSLSIIGNLDTTEKILLSAFSKEKVSEILEDIKGPMGKNTWDKLSNVNEDLLAAYLKNEHPQTIALIMSKLPSAMAAKVLTLLDEELTLEVMMRVLSINSVKTDVLEKIENTLRSDFISTLSKEQKRDSNELLAEIFNNFDRQSEAKYMSLLEGRSPEQATKVKELMFTFDDILKLYPSDVQLLLQKIDKSKLTLALKGANAEIRELFIDNMSKRAAKIFEEDMQALGPVKLRDVDEAQASITAVLKEMVDNEEVVLRGPEGEDEYIE